MSSRRLKPAARRRASTYILVLGVSTTVMVIGLSTLALVRIERRGALRAGDSAAAAHYAQAAIEMGFYMIRNEPTTWRTTFAGGGPPTKQPIGDGTYTLEAIDPTDGDLTNNDRHSVILIATGVQGDARHKLEVEVKPQNNGYEIVPGSWKQIVDSPP